jgi:DNA-directed RNA polymerase subunit M/transcription elongation factor TFIIS
MGNIGLEVPMIHFNCPSCNATLKVSDDNAGRVGKCAKCGMQICVPMKDGTHGEIRALVGEEAGASSQGEVVPSVVVPKKIEKTGFRHARCQRQAENDPSVTHKDGVVHGLCITGTKGQIVLFFVVCVLLIVLFLAFAWSIGICSGRAEIISR